MILGEMGRCLAPSPFLGTLLGTWAIARAGSAEQKGRLLPRIAAGELKLALAIADSTGTTDGPSRECAARGDRLTGVKSLAIDAAAADLLVCAAQDAATGGRAFFLLDARQPGVQIEPAALARRHAPSGGCPARRMP